VLPQIPEPMFHNILDTEQETERNLKLLEAFKGENYTLKE
jgi:hypothetical protein